MSLIAAGMGRAQAKDVLRDAGFKLRNIHRELGGSGGPPRRDEARASIARAIEHFEKALGGR